MIILLEKNIEIVQCLCLVMKCSFEEFGGNKPRCTFKTNKCNSTLTINNLTE